MAEKRRIWFSALMLALLCPSLALPGCGGGPIHLAKRFKPDPAVEWVFDAGKDLGFVLFFPIVGSFPFIADESVEVGAYRDSRVILLCLNSADEVFVPSRAYVLDVRDGRVLRSIAGPAEQQGMGLGGPIVTAERIYIPRHEDRESFYAFDLERGRVDWHPPQPNASVLREQDAAGYRHWYPLGPCEQTEATPSDPRTRYRFTLEHDRTLTIISEWQGVTFDLTWRGQDGATHTKRLLYRLPYRHSLGEALLANDDRRLLFAWTSYVICVDMRRLSAMSQPADADDRAR